ncbi:MAG: hypothetical protein IJ689_04695 [Alphaproteobacteria bacterium]|nr:hypothetical protein [Alphaproteobacteria bacterium]
MNKYILLLGVAGVALGSYCAYADNSATMTVTATIEHDVSLSNNGNLDLSVTIDPSKDSGWVDACTLEIDGEGVIREATDTGGFTANVGDNSRLSISPSSLSSGNITVDSFTIVPYEPPYYDVCGKLSYTGGAPAARKYNFGNITINYNPG